MSFRVIRTAMSVFIGADKAFAQVSGGPVNLSLTNPLGCPDLQCVVARIIDGLFIISIPIVTIMVLIGGFQIMTSGGDKEKLTTGKKTVFYAVVGFIVVGFAKSVNVIIQNVLGAR